jgi:type IV pilus biogenesis protein CpaD/CtpE
LIMTRTIHARRYGSRFAAALALAAIGAGCSTYNVGAAAPTAEHPCPAWVNFPQDPYSNKEPTYLGCSAAVNFTTTVDDPRDLEHGRTLAPADGARESLAIGQYETGQTKPLPSTGTPTPTIVFSGNSGASQ